MSDSQPLCSRPADSFPSWGSGGVCSWSSYTAIGFTSVELHTKSRVSNAQGHPWLSRVSVNKHDGRIPPYKEGGSTAKRPGF